MFKPSFFISHPKTRGFRKVDHTFKPGLLLLLLLLLLILLLPPNPPPLSSDTPSELLAFLSDVFSFAPLPDLSGGLFSPSRLEHHKPAAQQPVEQELVLSLGLALCRRQMRTVGQSWLPSLPELGRTPRGSCNRTLLRRVLRRFFKGSAS